MKPIEFPRIYHPLPLSDWAKEMAPQVVDIWVNPPRKDRAELDGVLSIASLLASTGKELQLQLVSAARKIEKAGNKKAGQEPGSEKLNQEAKELMKQFEENLAKRDAILARLWKIGGEEPTQEQVTGIRVAASENDPRFFDWLSRKTVEMIAVYRSGQKKSSLTPP